MSTYKLELRSLLLKAGVAASLLMTPVISQAVNPAFDTWTVASGVISGCPTASCTPLVEGDGFKQQQVVDGTVRYIQTIITDLGANAANQAAVQALPYSDESFIQLDASTGILSNQRTTSVTGTSTFTSTSALEMGWAATVDANNVPNPNMNISQGFTDTGGAATGDEFQNAFNVKLYIVNDVNGNPVVQGKSMTVDQVVEMGDGVTLNTTDVQRFVIEQRSGNQVATGGQLVLAPTSATTLNGGTVDWVAGDDVMVTWLGQSLNTNNGSTLFSYQSAKNLTTTGIPSANSFAETFSTTSTDVTTTPFAWDATSFGAAPTLPIL